MLRVRHAAQSVGTLSAEGRELRFAYAPAWLGAPHAFPLSPRMPLAEAPYVGEEVLFFFANLLPEGNVLDTLCQLRRLPRGNVFRMLEAFGRECAGAFELVPDTEPDNAVHSKQRYQTYSSAQLAADLASLRNNVPLLQSHGELRLSLAGAQNKIPVRYADGQLFLPAQGAPSTHILKPALQPDALFQDSVLNEVVCLRLAQAAGLDAPEVQVLTGPEPVMLIERYDRIVQGQHVQRLHQLDFCQLTGVLPDQKYETDGGPGFVDVFAQIDRLSAMPALDRLKLVDWLLYNFLIGNADAHGKNVSMLYGVDGSLRLAPAYDLLSLAHWPQLSQKMAMGIGGEHRPEWVIARHWQGLCETVGLNITQLRKRAIDLASRTIQRLPQVLADVQHIGSDRFADSFAATLERRARWIETRLTAAESNTQIKRPTG
ncbi:MAG TPA: type II toxin-antitoxin system HipA family toxin [Luteimonas sp.]|nr:type II toxin-antitoxin system HipA family toxin [Luteimonas sp.]